MHRITLDGVELDLTDMTLRWESVNTLFEDDALQGDYSFPSTLKYSDVNMKALGFAHKADVPTVSVTFDIILFLDERSIRSKLIINGTNRNGFNINIAGGVSGLVNADRSLKKLPFFFSSTGDGTIDLGPAFGNMALYQYINWKLAIAFPVHYNPTFYDDKNPDFQGVINRMDATVGNFLTNTILTGSKYCFVPFLYIHYILKTIADENGLGLGGTYWSDPEQATALLYNNYALDKKEEQGCLVKSDTDQVFNYLATFYDIGLPSQFAAWPADISNTVSLKDTLTDCYDPQDNWDSVVSDVFYIPTNGDYSARFTLKIGTPTTIDYSRAAFIELVYVDPSMVEHIMAQENYFAFDTGFKEIEVLGTIAGALATGRIYARVTNNTIVTITPVDIADTYLVQWVVKSDAQLMVARYDVSDFNIMDPIVVLKNHVPDITVSEFLRLIKNQAQVQMNIDWDARMIYFDYAETTIVNQSEVNLTEIADPNYEQVFDEKDQGFTLSYDFGTTDALIDGNFLAIDESKIVGEYIRESDLPTPAFLNDLAIVINKNQVFRVENIATVFTWVYYSDYHYPIVYGKAKKVRKIALAPMLMTDAQTNESATSDPDDIICLMPCITETGSSPLFDLGLNDPSTRMVFMRGKIAPGTFGGKYIYASSTNYDVNGVRVGNFTLKLAGLDGWYIRFLQKILVAIDYSAVFEYLINLPTSYLRYKGKVQIANVNYLIKNISMISGTFVKQSLVKLLKL